MDSTGAATVKSISRHVHIKWVAISLDKLPLRDLVLPLILTLTCNNIIPREAPFNQIGKFISCTKQWHTVFKYMYMYMYAGKASLECVQGVHVHCKHIMPALLVRDLISGRPDTHWMFKDPLKTPNYSALIINSMLARTIPNYHLTPGQNTSK